ncbi:helix-turn-helix domain-containing protein [Alkalihalobacillus sp. TS-13]|uniref:response regulator transcription factor n=1 Tax=Alkalihalobacillus sp. TS-13 TaxID=2842455 RepID=UPI001C88B054|nr:helix-turn-helix domain-containing protein [Alkalihalobacillus sp. TS-13]
MYKVALVDDDVLVLRFLEKMIPWEDYGFKIAGSFKDSMEAYDHLKTKGYDVLITDIGMPKLDGIELISLLNNNGVDLFNVILSCHDEFHYAQQALKLDAFDYLLKESMDQEKIEELLKRLKKAMDNKRQRETKSDKISSFFKKNKTKLKTEFIEKLLEDNYVDDDSWWNEQGELLEMNFSYEHYTPVLCFIDKSVDAIEKYEKQTLLYFSIDNIVIEILNKYRLDIQIFYLQSKFFIVFPHGEENPGVMYTKIGHVLQEIHSKLESHLKITITSVIGKGNKLRKGLINSMKELLQKEEQRFYYQHRSIQHLKILPFEKPAILEDYIEIVEKITSSIIQEDERRVTNIIKKQLNEMRNSRCEPSIVQDWAVKLVLDINQRLQTFTYFEDSILTSMTDKLVNQVYTLDHLEEMVIGICKQLILHLEKMDDIPKTGEIAKVQKYVQMNIHKKITLNDVANYLHLNPSYFSRLYKEVTGESFVEYVTRVKMAKARVLLSGTTKTVDQISVELGFESKSYFLKKFKKFYGNSPKSYRFKEGV